MTPSQENTPPPKDESPKDESLKGRLPTTRKLSPKQRKWIRRLLILLLIRFVIGGVLYYIVVYRFKDLAQIAVKKESRGLYSFDASDVEFSLWKKSLIVEDAVLHCNDTVNTRLHHDLQVPRIYLSILSWTDLVFHKKIEIDSMDIQLPALRSHEHGDRPAGRSPLSHGADTTASGNLPIAAGDSTGFQASRVLGMLQNLLTHLQVRALDVRNGSFAYSNTKTNTPFLSNKINFLIRNFKSRANRRDHLLSSDDIDLSIEDQQWNLPDGIHSLAFKRLHFSGKDQFFEIDSCHFHAAAAGDRNEILFSADKLFFNSRELSAIYEKGELLIDTLICFHPVLHLPNPGKQPKRDSLAAPGQTIRHVFKDISFRYIDVREGQLILGAGPRPSADNQAGNRSAYGTQKTDLRIYNLGLHPDQEPSITSDSIQLSLRKTQFLTRDSLFELSIDELVLHNNDVVFKNASFGPTDRNHADKSIHFTTPLLRLKDISLQDLVNKKLKASRAELIEPSITLADNGSGQGFDKDRSYRAGQSKHTAQPASLDSLAAAEKANREISHFYTNLHALGELIDVPDFRIVDGQVDYRSTGRIPVSMKMNKLNAQIYLDHFLTSDSLIDIKRSMPALTVKDIAVESKTVKLHIEDYHFQGSNRHNGAGHIKLSLANGTTLDGKDLYWEILDWDQYQRYRIIMIETLKAGELIVNLKKTSAAPAANASTASSPGLSSDSSANSSPNLLPNLSPNRSANRSANSSPNRSRRNLPAVHIGRIDIGRLAFSTSSPDQDIRLGAREICLDEVNTNRRFFTWNNIEGQFDFVSLRSGNTKASIGKIFFDNASESILQDLNGEIKIRSRAATRSPESEGSVHIQIPRLRLNLPIRSTDPTQWQLLSLTMDQPVIEVHKNQPSANNLEAQKKSPPFSLPVAIHTNKIDINKAHIRYISGSPKDTLSLLADLDLHLKDLQTSKDGNSWFQFQLADVDIAALHLDKDRLALDLPHATLRLQNGSAQKVDKGKTAFNADLLLKWYDSRLKIAKPGKMELFLENLSGSFHTEGFSSNAANPLYAGNPENMGNTGNKGRVWAALAEKLTLHSGKLFYKSKNTTLQAASLKWQPEERIFSLGSFSVNPNLSMDETFKKEGAWQSDYMLVSGDLINIHGMYWNRRPGDTTLSVRKIEVEGVSLATFRDKRMPFKHGEEKPMPTKLINTIPYPLRIDTVTISRSNVTVNEIALITKKQGTVPLQDINATITHISNYDHGDDSLTIIASMKMLNNNIRHFYYRESYADTLSAYRLSLNASPMELPSFNKATVPLASVDVEQGRSDTLFAQWAGNKYASFGSMNFHYKDLKVKLLDPSDAERKTFLLALENALANSIVLHKNNSKESYVFFERDREKFVFNYWVKSALKGTLSSIGLKSNRKYLRQYKTLRKTYPLPEAGKDKIQKK
ncbi:MAG: hypothetical protein P4L51_10300 [Puia sp.]|nr:hypothetical protein [Puia sp.]